LVALQNAVQNGTKWCKSSCHDVVLEFFATNAPNPPHWTQNSCFVVFHTIFGHLGPFGCVTKLSAKRAKLMQKFVPRSCFGIFCNERNRSTPLDSKLMFWCVLYYLDAFGTIWLAFKIRCNRGRSGAKVRAIKSCRNFSQRTRPIHPFGPLPHVSVHFVLFGCIWDSLLRYNTQFKTGQTCAKVRSTKSRRNFSQRTHPIHPIGL
jgi:hypothetical protein